MRTNTELALLNNKNWLLPSPDREFQKSVAETSPFRPQQKNKKPTKPVNSSFVSIFPLFKLLDGEIYLAVSWYIFVCFILHIHRILHFCVPRLKFLEPKWSQPVKSIINYSLIVIENILLATALYDSTKLFLNFSTSSLLSAAQNSNNFVESKIA